MPDVVQLVTLAPGHFHAALVQKEMLPGVDPHVHVFAPHDTDLDNHLKHIARFNARPDRPTAWTTEIHCGTDWFDRFLAERPGNTVVIAGRNRPKIDLILAAVAAGYCVLADKPWIVEAVDFPKLERVFAEAQRNGVFAWDVMTERFEETSRLQRELIANADIFGDVLAGSIDEPALEIESTHYLIKSVDGVPLRRPAWWFDPAVAGEAMADVGTHLVDLALWLLFPNQAVEYRSDVEVIQARRWPTHVSPDEFQAMTGLPTFPVELAHLCNGEELIYCGNGSATVRIRDCIVRFTTRWGVRSSGPEGDTHLAIARGTRSTVTVRHEPEFGPGPQVFVTPDPKTRLDVSTACSNRYDAADLGDRLHIAIPDGARSGHEAHFARVLSDFVCHKRDWTTIPTWESPNLLSKYYITTQAVELARRNI